MDNDLVVVFVVDVVVDVDIAILCCCCLRYMDSKSAVEDARAPHSQ